MYALDFEYDGRCLSEYDFIICYFDHSSGSDTVSAGSNISFNTIAKSDGKRYTLINTEYSDCISTSFDICKNPEKYNADEMQISDNEFREIMRWLNRREYLPFHVFDLSENKKERCFYNASFNIEKIMINEILYGLRLNLETDSPFGYGDTREFLFTLSANSSMSIVDTSDEIGEIYPMVEITCNASGDLELYNSKMTNQMTIQNCSNGEHIIIDCENQIITTSNNAHNIMNDFNYRFFKIINDYDDRVNIIASSLPIVIRISYRPVIKNSI